MKSFLFLGLVSFLAISCSNNKNNSNLEQSEQKEVVISNDMENAAAKIPSWNNEVTVIKMVDAVKAHSGEYASKVDKNNVYSYAYAEALKNINKIVPRKVIVNGWVNCVEPSDETIIAIDINENNKTVLWRGNPIKSFVKSQNEWHEFTTEFIIDQPITIDQQIKIFAFGGGKTAYFDDIVITFEY